MLSTQQLMLRLPSVNLFVVWSVLMSLPRRSPLALAVFDLTVAAVCLANCLSWPARALLWLGNLFISFSFIPLMNS